MDRFTLHCSQAFILISCLLHGLNLKPLFALCFPFMSELSSKFINQLDPMLYFQILIRVEMLTAPTKASATRILPGDLLVSAKMTAHHTRNKSVLQMVELSRTCVSSKKKFAKHVEITRTITLGAAEVIIITYSQFNSSEIHCVLPGIFPWHALYLNPNFLLLRNVYFFVLNHSYLFEVSFITTPKLDRIFHVQCSFVFKWHKG